jgi:hypothetical protein
LVSGHAVDHGANVPILFRSQLKPRALGVAAVALAVLAAGTGSSAQDARAANETAATRSKAAAKTRVAAKLRTARATRQSLKRGTIATPVIVSGPPTVTDRREASFDFKVASTGTLQCRLDGGQWRTCKPPALYTGLGLGSHVFAVRLVKGFVVSDSASHGWTIKAVQVATSPPPPAPPALLPASPPSAPPSSPSTPTAPASDSTGSITPSATVGVAAPTPPATYSLPAGAVWVTSAAELNAALAATSSRDIVLADGTYDQAGPFNNYWGHRLYAEHLGKARFTAGLTFGQYWGTGSGLIRGVVFDITDPGKTLQSAVIHIWGSGAGTRVLDVTIDGHNVVQKGILAKQPEGVEVSRVVARNFLEFAVRVDGEVYNTILLRPALVQDVNASNVSLPTPLISDGKAEACVWIGSTATVRRIRTRDCAWMGVWAGTSAHRSLFEDIDIDRTQSGVGLYIEHFVHDSTFRRLRIAGPTITRGVVCEWADPGWGGQPACVRNVIEDSYFDTTCVGVLMDEGTTSTTVRRSTFVNQRWAAIDNFRGISNLGDTAGNSYVGIKPGAVPLSTAHWSSSGC